LTLINFGLWDGWLTDLCQISSRGRDSITAHKLPQRSIQPPNQCVPWAFSSEANQPGMKLTTHLCLESTSRMHGATCTLSFVRRVLVFK